ncbi:MAG: hypothetical protein IPO31_15790 [Candidatus Obscuribacter sp.]|nr:hypothetical protein [Candidatus Obscuribacter sp.]
MAILSDLSDTEIRELIGEPIRKEFELRVNTPGAEQELEFCTLFPERQPYGQLLVDSIRLETGELTIFAIHQLAAQCVLTTRRLIWLNDSRTIQSVRLNNIKDVGMLADSGDPAYPADHYHYLQDRVLKEGSPTVGVNSKDCALKFNSQFLYLIEVDGRRHVIYLVKQFPIQTVITALSSVAAEEVALSATDTPKAHNNQQPDCNRSCKLQYWFETHGLKVTDRTLYYHDLDKGRKDTIASKVALPPNNEIVLCSFFDDNNFLLVGDRYLAWHSDTDGGSVPLQNVDIFHRQGDVADDRFPDKIQSRSYHDGRVMYDSEIAQDSPHPQLNLWHGSPLVFIRNTSGDYYDFKVEPGRQVDTIWIGILSGKCFLASEQQREII